MPQAAVNPANANPGAAAPNPNPAAAAPVNANPAAVAPAPDPAAAAAALGALTGPSSSHAYRAVHPLVAGMEDRLRQGPELGWVARRSETLVFLQNARDVLDSTAFSNLLKAYQSRGEMVGHLRGYMGDDIPYYASQLEVLKGQERDRALSKLRLAVGDESAARTAQDQRTESVKDKLQSGTFVVKDENGNPLDQATIEKLLNYKSVFENEREAAYRQQIAEAKAEGAKREEAYQQKLKEREERLSMRGQVEAEYKAAQRNGTYSDFARRNPAYAASMAQSEGRSPEVRSSSVTYSPQQYQYELQRINAGSLTPTPDFLVKHGFSSEAQRLAGAYSGVIAGLPPSGRAMVLGAAALAQDLRERAAAGDANATYALKNLKKSLETITIPGTVPKEAGAMIAAVCDGKLDQQAGPGRFQRGLQEEKQIQARAEVSACGMAFDSFVRAGPDVSRYQLRKLSAERLEEMANNLAKVRAGDPLRVDGEHPERVAQREQQYSDFSELLQKELSYKRRAAEIIGRIEKRIQGEEVEVQALSRPAIDYLRREAELLKKPQVLAYLDKIPAVPAQSAPQPAPAGDMRFASHRQAASAAPASTTAREACRQLYALHLPEQTEAVAEILRAKRPAERELMAREAQAALERNPHNAKLQNFSRWLAESFEKYPPQNLAA